MKEYQSHIIAVGGTVIILLLFFLLLLKLTITAPVPVEDDGIIITFGDAEEGGGTPDVLPMPDPITQAAQEPSAPAPAPAEPSNNDLMVQEAEESLAMPEQSEEDAQRMAEEAYRKMQEEARIEAERIAKEKALAEQKAREEEAIKKAQAMTAMFGQAGATTGANAENATSTPSASSKGNPVGKNFGQVDGNMWALQGRSVRTMPKPSTDFKEPGKVVVNIRVDKAGNVLAASIGDGTTISDRHTQQLAIAAARKAKFSEGDKEQIGSITYHFKLN